MNILTTLCILFISSVFTPLQAQNHKFGKVSQEELKERFYALDSSAHAAILYKNRYTKLDYHQGIGWRSITKVHERIKLYDKDGFKWASKALKLYTDKDHESISIKGYSYNLENGKVQKTKLNNSEIFDENINEHWNQKKFTMPDLKEGSIVEWEYTITSPFFWKIDDLELQTFIPIKKMETYVHIPEYFVYKNVSKGYLPIHLNNSVKRSSINLGEGDLLEFNANITECNAQNVPALKNEPYVNNIANYLSSINYELTSTQFPNARIEYYSTSWSDVTKTIYDSSNFGGQLDKSNHFNEELLQTVNAQEPASEKISRVLGFVKSKIKWNDYTGIYAEMGVKKAYKDGVGNVADINLNLVAMLREVGLNASPVLTSTRDHGVPLFPTTDGFNYVIAAVELPTGIVLLDATEPNSTPNVLPLRTINWQGRLVRKDGSSVDVNLFPTTYSTTKTLLNVKLSDDQIFGLDRTIFSNNHALSYRNAFMGVDQDDLKAKFERDEGGIEIEELKVSNETDLTKPIVVNTKFNSDQYIEEIGDNLYFSALFYLSEDENPFKLDNREFPVDFGTPWEESFSVSVEIPEGYTVKSKPVDIAIGLPDQLGTYKFKAMVKGNQLQVLSHLKINSALIAPIYYPALKDFYQQIINKQIEKTVLSKI